MSPELQIQRDLWFEAFIYHCGLLRKSKLGQIVVLGIPWGEGEQSPPSCHTAPGIDNRHTYIVLAENAICLTLRQTVQYARMSAYMAPPMAPKIPIIVMASRSACENQFQRLHAIPPKSLCNRHNLNKPILRTNYLLNPRKRDEAEEHCATPR